MRHVITGRLPRAVGGMRGAHDCARGRGGTGLAISPVWSGGGLGTSLLFVLVFSPVLRQTHIPVAWLQVTFGGLLLLFGMSWLRKAMISEPLKAQPREILIIRHAEKPDSADDPNLTPRGYARAVALVQFFSASFDTPDYLFATQASKHSNRPVETITPLAGALHMPVDSKVADADYLLFAQDILTNPQYTGKMLIICWHHGTIKLLRHTLKFRLQPCQLVTFRIK